jgi:hypothetical protein
MQDGKLLELLHAAIRSGHVVLVGAEETFKELPGLQHVQLRGDVSSVTAAVAQQKTTLVVCAACMPISAAYLCRFCLAVVEIVIVMYACMAAYMRYK